MSEGQDGGTPGADVPANAETTAEVATETTQDTATEETAKKETTEPEGSEQPDKPKRPSGYERMKRRALLAEAQLANARLREVGTKGGEEASDAKAPREEDFGGDWGKFIAATAAYEASKAVKTVLTDDKKSRHADRAAELQSEVMADFEERKEEFKAKATDFDDVVEKFVSGGGKFSEAVRDLVIDSDVGPQLTYHLAKNPALANKLSALPPLQAAKEIARLEDSLSKPSQKQTKAPPPVKPVTGGAAPSSPDADLDAWLKKTYG